MYRNITSHVFKISVQLKNCISTISNFIQSPTPHTHVLLCANLYACVLFVRGFIVPDEDVKKYCERLKRRAEPPVQVDEVDSCFPRTAERVGITLEDDPEGQYLCKSLFGFLFLYD